MKKYCIILLFCSLACGRMNQPEDSLQAPVSFSLDTKSLGAGEHTFRATLTGLFSNEVAATGTYCSEIINHEKTPGDGMTWLSPCRVNNEGQPLKSDGTEASGLAEADKDSRYGLRKSDSGTYSLVVASPAKRYTVVNYSSYYPWTPSGGLYISEPVIVSFSGSWLDGQYVYNSSANEALVMKDRRSRLYIRIECGKLSEAYIQSVSLLNIVNSGRWYLKTGFSANNCTTYDLNLYDCSGTPMHLVKATNDYWASTEMELFLPSIDYSSDTYSAIRPRIKVLMGNDPAHPSEAVVTITEPMEPMKNYTFNLLVSKSDVVVTLTSSPWDDGGTISSVDDEEPAVIGTVTINGWTESTSNTDPWNTHF